MSDSAATTELLAAAKDAAARNIDCYALLGLSSTADDPDAPPLTRDVVQRAWRKRSLKYHPDSAGAAFDKDRWEEFGLARDILASDEARAAYDGVRAAAQQKRRERDLMSARQRQFAEELERAEGGSARMREEEGRRKAGEDAERERQAARGRALAEERRRKVEEAEEREREREKREDEERDDKIRRLEEKIADKARRRAEKRAKRESRRSGIAMDEDVEMVSPRPDAPVAPAVESKPAERTTIPVPTMDIKMSDDPVTFWNTQWPKTKGRLLAAQATKERRVKEAQAVA